MPEYLYENPDTGEQISVWQSVHEEHSYEIEGVPYGKKPKEPLGIYGTSQLSPQKRG